ncbi:MULTISPECIES: GLPGLI family protein [Elizabethkingia]|uniref:GLPGLI family protein n=1 Tax=Elizabethkingia meningoseptica TaxID=238 RepID=A0A1T3F1I7_ELIME|nr:MULTISPECIES: GLPGLI family protein [Elizabethkingia]AQX11802.1 GLPGLI family protein [Elizabethkingia meningoseptica]MBG0513247.1 GLPGLI family protein [Elizabethkingia meningoseptica]MDE5434602.1 GLPGLI family protein [Elizabethkingia meningoseptica]MDE5482849.1 GLPGLI family protein [Elizabethkingia meningoseptica]MDE5537205.1 GLPGLI family protein [Elizabethkingia meningoseptica]
MKKLTLLFVLTFGVMVMAQETANRFVYELTYKPKKDSTGLEKELMALDITKSKSIYRDYISVSQDSIIKDMVEKAQKAGVFDPNFMSKMKQPKFSTKLIKTYPSMKIQNIEMIFAMMKPMAISYSENLIFNWKVLPDKMKIGEYNAQKATTEFGGRTWNAWFSTDLPFQDGPYKFSGLPGLIVKIEDDGKNYSWVLQGNKKISNYEEQTYGEKMMNMAAPTDISKEKFEKTFTDFKKDPFGSIRQYLKPEMMSQKFPGSDKTMGDYMKDQQRILDKLYNTIDNPIELTQGSVNMGKGTQEVVK